ncbi:hypothetical protein RFI_22693 [Reticulomyxa filosa]|uniref:Uncharacterized protein n=1 Tax=Reticulomyxa filosa TaxID=46433 RepID=X6MLZ2_RETFI|nr:hypothetical protein RFI_22693 [Reticulomyxa filosa]|eukprot:ETO14676.1 hypothetical protein RFI_22693 [Reticulomyxa filosa]
MSPPVPGEHSLHNNGNGNGKPPNSPLKKQAFTPTAPRQGTPSSLTLTGNAPVMTPDHDPIDVPQAPFFAPSAITKQPTVGYEEEKVELDNASSQESDVDRSVDNRPNRNSNYHDRDSFLFPSDHAFVSPSQLVQTQTRFQHKLSQDILNIQEGDEDAEEDDEEEDDEEVEEQKSPMPSHKVNFYHLINLFKKICILFNLYMYTYTYIYICVYTYMCVIPSFKAAERFPSSPRRWILITK